MTEPSLATIERRHDLDALRATAMLLGIVLHGALAYLTIPFWPVPDDHTHISFDVIFTAIHGFRMPLFFVLSGFFTAMLWRKRGIRGTIKQRGKRILLPLAIFVIPIYIAMIGTFVALNAVENSGNVSMAGTDSIWSAAKNNDVEALAEHLNQVEDINATDPRHHLTALHWAALNGSLNAADWLVDRGADINAKIKDGSTPLTHAAFTGRPKIVELLIAHGADLNPVNTFRSTPLDAAMAEWGIVAWIAGTLELELGEQDVKAGQLAAIELLKAHGGKRNTELQLERHATKDDKGQALNLTQAYLKFTDWSGFHKGEIFGHLWFLWFLILLMVPFVMYAWLMDLMKWRGPPKWLVLSPALMLWLIPVTIVPQAFSGLRDPSFGPDTSITLFPLPHILLLYAVYFFFGVLYHDADDTEGKLGRYWWLTLPIALLVVYPVGVTLALEPEHKDVVATFSPDMIRPFSVVFQVVYAWMMITGSIGLFRKVASVENATVRYISDSSYWLYIAHLPLIFLAQGIAKPWDVHAWVKFVFVCVSVTVVLLVAYDWMIRYTWVGTMLNGKRERPAKA